MGAGADAVDCAAAAGSVAVDWIVAAVAGLDACNSFAFVAAVAEMDTVAAAACFGDEDGHLAAVEAAAAAAAAAGGDTVDCGQRAGPWGVVDRTEGKERMNKRRGGRSVIDQWSEKRAMLKLTEQGAASRVGSESIIMSLVWSEQ